MDAHVTALVINISFPLDYYHHYYIIIFPNEGTTKKTLK